MKKRKKNTRKKFNNIYSAAYKQTRQMSPLCFETGIILNEIDISLALKSSKLFLLLFQLWLCLA